MRNEKLEIRNWVVEAHGDGRSRQNLPPGMLASRWEPVDFDEDSFAIFVRPCVFVERRMRVSYLIP